MSTTSEIGFMPVAVEQEQDDVVHQIFVRTPTNDSRQLHLQSAVDVKLEPEPPETESRSPLPLSAAASLAGHRKVVYMNKKNIPRDLWRGTKGHDNEYNLRLSAARAEFWKQTNNDRGTTNNDGLPIYTIQTKVRLPNPELSGKNFFSYFLQNPSLAGRVRNFDNKALRRDTLARSKEVNVYPLAPLSLSSRPATRGFGPSRLSRLENNLALLSTPLSDAPDVSSVAPVNPTKAVAGIHKEMQQAPLMTTRRVTLSSRSKDLNTNVSSGSSIGMAHNSLSMSRHEGLFNQGQSKLPESPSQGSAPETSRNMTAVVLKPICQYDQSNSSRSQLRHTNSTRVIFSATNQTALAATAVASKSNLTFPRTELGTASTYSTHFNSPFAERFSRSSDDDRAMANPRWQERSVVNIFVRQLPRDVTTLEIYKHFEPFGQICKVEILSDTNDSWKKRAEVRFKPPPKEALWEKLRQEFKRDNVTVTKIEVQFSDRQPTHERVKSPVQPSTTYPASIELNAVSIKFGVLVSPKSMMTMATRSSNPDGQVKFMVNLRRKEIEVRFPSLLRSTKRTAVREYRFFVSFDQNFSVNTVDEGSGTSIILRVHVPPPYSKKLREDVYKTHAKDSSRWLEEDMWLRQTNIVNNKEDFQMLSKLPVSMHDNQSAINIGRWTTFRIALTEETRQSVEFRAVITALRDFSIQIPSITNFQYVDPMPPVWEKLDKDFSTEPHKGLETNVSSLESVFASISLPFEVRYLLEACISTGRLCEYTVNEDFIQKLNELRDGDRLPKLENRRAINKLNQILDLSPDTQLWHPMDIFDSSKYRSQLRRYADLPENCALMHSATVTATTMIFHPPSVEITNRIVRQYGRFDDRFLRVRFEDDEYRGNSIIYGSTSNKNSELYSRVRRTLTNGIRLGDRHYEFLAWGNSQLREHGAYFFASLPGVVEATQIRAVMGDFDHEKIIAKRAARMGQCFSTTKAITIRVPRVDPKNLLPDIKRNGFTFSDGVGKISVLLAAYVAQQLHVPPPVPSVFQFRLGGCKGVLAVSNELSGVDLQIRVSQFKFPSESNDLEIIKYSGPLGAALNRQLILILSALGVENEIFLEMQEKEKEQLALAMDSDPAALKILRERVDPNKATLDLASMIEFGFRTTHEPFVTSLLHLWRSWSLKYLKEKAKLNVPQGACVLGCVDETATLQGHFASNQPAEGASYEDRVKALPQIFLQVTDQATGQCSVVEELCILARNPSLHEGDIRVVKAVNVPALAHIRDAVVLPQTGDRDLSSMCSGGDLDGDDYLVIWNKGLLPKIWNAPPMDYTPPPPLMANGNITQIDIINFFHQYMKYNLLGKIAHAHLGWADFKDEGIRSQECLDLARLHSVAVDFSKTGVPADMPRSLEVSEWPHFMEKKSGRWYKSRKVLGVLFDAVGKVDFEPNYDAPFDQRILDARTPSKEIIIAASELKVEYDTCMRRIMAKHDIKTEFEVWSTFALSHSRASPDFKFHEELGNLSRALKDQFDKSIRDAAGGQDFEHLADFAVAAYQITHAEFAVALAEVEAGNRNKTPQDMPFISFPWILSDTLGKLVASPPKSNRLMPEESPTASTTNGSSFTHVNKSENTSTLSKPQLAQITPNDTGEEEEEFVVVERRVRLVDLE